MPATWKLNSVRLGEWDTTTTEDCDDSFTNERVCSDPYVDITVEKQIVHEDYQPNSKNQHHDIALLRLSRNVRYTEFIRPVCLPWGSNLINMDLSGTAMEVSGWGKTETSSTSTKKLKVNINAYSNSKCQGVYTPSNIQIIDSQVSSMGLYIQVHVSHSINFVAFRSELSQKKCIDRLILKKLMVNFIVRDYVGSLLIHVEIYVLDTCKFDCHIENNIVEIVLSFIILFLDKSSRFAPAVTLERIHGKLKDSIEY